MRFIESLFSAPKCTQSDEKSGVLFMIRKAMRDLDYISIGIVDEQTYRKHITFYNDRGVLGTCYEQNSMGFKWTYTDEEGDSVNIINNKTGDINTGLKVDILKKFLFAMNKVVSERKPIRDEYFANHAAQLKKQQQQREGEQERLLSKFYDAKG